MSITIEVYLPDRTPNVPIYANSFYCFSISDRAPRNPRKRSAGSEGIYYELDPTGAGKMWVRALTSTTLVAGRTTHVSVGTDPSLIGKNHPVSYLNGVPVSPALPRKLVKLADSNEFVIASYGATIPAGSTETKLEPGAGVTQKPRIAPAAAPAPAPAPDPAPPKKKIPPPAPPKKKIPPPVPPKSPRPVDPTPGGQMEVHGVGGTAGLEGDQDLDALGEALKTGIYERDKGDASTKATQIMPGTTLH